MVDSVYIPTTTLCRSPNSCEKRKVKAELDNVVHYKFSHRLNLPARFKSMPRNLKIISLSGVIYKFPILVSHARKL